MKKLVSFTWLVMMSFVASCSDYQTSLIAKYQEGVHYNVVSDKVTDKPEVREFFSFYCPHCFSFEPFMQKLASGLPEGVPFEKNHVDFLRAATPEIQFMLSKALVIAEKEGKEKEVVSALFNYIHVQHAKFTSEKDIKNVLIINGLDADKVDKLFSSFAVDSQAKGMKKRQDELSKKGALTSVPTVFVNGKYRVNAQALDRNNIEQDYQNLVKYLLTLDK